MDDRGVLTRFEEFQELLDRVSYKPGWTFYVAPGAEGRPILKIQAMVRDVEQPHEMIPITCSGHVWPEVDEHGFFTYVREAIARIELHEVDEHYKIGSVHFKAPHGPEALGYEAALRGAAPSAPVRLELGLDRRLRDHEAGSNSSTIARFLARYGSGAL